MSLTVFEPRPRLLRGPIYQQYECVNQHWVQWEQSCKVQKYDEGPENLGADRMVFKDLLECLLRSVCC